jgi:hypothetical protein
MVLAPHRLDDLVGEKRALVEVDVGLGRRLGNVRVGGKVNGGVVAGHRLCQRLEVLDIAFDDREAPIFGVRLDVPAPPGREVVVDGDSRRRRIAKQPVDEVTADEARAANNDVTFRHV